MRLVVRLLTLSVLLVLVAFAQRDLGTITGTVIDQSGAAVPNASITVTQTSTGESYKLLTSGTGDFTRPALQPGMYTVAAEAPGFKRAVQENVEVTAGGRVGVPLTLQVGQANESVAVVAEAPLVQNESTQLGAQLNAEAVANLPLGGQRVFTYLARLSPGIVPGESGRDANTGSFSANGVRSLGQNNFLLNGVDNNVNVIDFLNGAAFVIGPPPEAIGEMQILTSGYNAEYGRAAGGVVNVNLKSGTNQLHGDVWEDFQNDKLNANSWQNNRLGQPKPVFKQNQFGGAAGGPILRNRFFVFGDYQGTRIAKVNGSGLVTIPTQAEVGGDFSGLLGGVIGTDALGRPINQGEIYDPATTQTVNGQLVRDPFPGNKIPSNRFDPAAAKMLALFPPPNQLVSGFPQNDYYYSSAGHNMTDSGDIRSDFKLNDRNNFYGSLSWNDNAVSSTAPFSKPGLGSAGGLGGDTQATYTRNGQVGYTRVWAPSIVSESRVGITRLTTSIVGPDGNAGDLYKSFGIGGYDPTSALAQNGGLPGVSPSRYQGFGAGGWQPMRMQSNVQDFIQNVAISKGSHSFKVGGEVRLIQYPFVQVSDPHGDFNVNQNPTAYPSVANSLNTNTGDSIASFLLGAVDSAAISTTNLINSQKKTFAVYFQDDWKVSSKLTLNLGVRYELFSPTYERDGRQSNFDFGTATLYIPQGADQNAPLPPNFAASYPNVKVSRGQVSKYMFPWDKTDIGPRVGVAYKLRQKTVIRGGFGMFFGGEENLGGNPNLGEGPPFNTTVNLNNTGTFNTNPFLPGGFSAGFPTNVFNLPAGVAFRGIALDYKNPLVQKWNLAVQHELPGSMALEAAYVGNNQIHQNVLHNANSCPNVGTTLPVSCDSLRPIALIGQGTVVDTFGRGNYHAFTAKLEKRLSNGLEFISSYTWSHAISNSCTPLTGCNVYDPLNYNSGYADALWDIRHNFTTGFTWVLPVGKGKAFGSQMNRVLNQIVGGWDLNGILTLRTGVPLTLGYNGCQGLWNSCRPDIVGGMDANGAPAGGRSAAQWFNTSAVAVPTPLTGGDAGAFNIRGPGTRSLDASLFKTFSLAERVRMEFRIEAFNAFNTTHLGNPDMNLQDKSFGSINSSSGQRSAQLSLRLHF